MYWKWINTMWVITGRKIYTNWTYTKWANKIRMNKMYRYFWCSRSIMRWRYASWVCWLNQLKFNEVKNDEARIDIVWCSGEQEIHARWSMSEVSSNFWKLGVSVMSTETKSLSWSCEGAWQWMTKTDNFEIPKFNF